MGLIEKLRKVGRDASRPTDRIPEKKKRKSFEDKAKKLPENKGR